MAMQTGIGFSKILILGAAGYTGTIFLKNVKLSDLIGELQSLIQGLEKSGGDSSGDAEYADAVTAQVRRLTMEVRQLASRQITVVNGSAREIGNITSLAVPVATMGALGYGYMWWKGYSFSDLMYVTKRNMANAVSNLSKHLEQVSEAVSAAKKHLTQRIQNLDDKMDEQKEMSKLIKNEVENVRFDISAIGGDLGSLQYLVSDLNGKISSLEYKQNFANAGVVYLCNFVDGKRGDMPSMLKEQLKLSSSGRSRGLLTSPDIKGLKDLADCMISKRIDRATSDLTVHDNGDQPKSLMRAASSAC